MPVEWSVTVTQLNEYVRKMISGDPMLRQISVRGEISGFKRHISGHLYFTLKDEGARVQCVMFRQYAQELCIQPRDGMKVTATASASLYAQSGTYQLYVESMRQEGAGELYLQFEALKQRLGAEGLFDPSVKKAIPMLPKIVGVVTSRTGAVLRDIVRVARRRNPKATILLAAASVQGMGAAEEIASAIRRLNRDGRAEVILCGRGGGSMEDLWPFNEEIVARAIFESEIPVISCVGHETDFTIADFVADLRAPTPSAAAELAVPVVDELKHTADVLVMRMTRALMNRQEMYRSQLSALAKARVLSDPRRTLIGERRRTADELERRFHRALYDAQNQRKNALYQQTLRLMGGRHRLSFEGRRQKVNTLEERMTRALRLNLQQRREQADSLSRMLFSLNPANVLERGYAAVYVDGKAVSEANGIAAGAEIGIRMRDGEMTARITRGAESF